MKTKRNFKLSLIGWMVAVLAWALLCTRAHGSDLVKGYTFLPTDRVTSTKLNNLVDAGYISTDFYTLRTPYTAPLQTDTIVVYSVSAAAFRKITLDYLIFSNTNLIALQTEDTSPAPGDFTLTYDVSASALKKVQLVNLLRNSITNQTADLLPDTNDVVMTFDVSAGALAKADLNALVFTNNNLIATRTNYAAADPTNTYFLAVNAGNWFKQNPTNIVWSAAPRFTGTLAMTAGPNFQFAHGLPGVPQVVRAVLACTSADKGYAVGSEVEVPSDAVTVSTSAAVINVEATSTTPSINDRTLTTRSAITAAKWNLKVYATFYY